MNLDERKKRILASIVENYIESAEPVGSQKIADEYEREFSSATIRSEMKILEENGYLEQPHISSGRVPSTKGYRYYVDNLMRGETLSLVDIDYINNNITSYGDSELTLENAANVISKILKIPTILKIESYELIENVKILKISDKILLIVLMSDSGKVKDVIIKITDSIPKTKLDEFSKLLNKNLKGTPFQNLPEILTRAVHSELKRFSSILEEMHKSIKFDEYKNTTKVKGSLENILALPEFENMQEMKKFLNIINTEEILKDVLDKIEDKNVNIIIGNENQDILLKDYSIMSLDIKDKNTSASIGIVTPKRVDYKKASTTLMLVSEKLQNIFSNEKKSKEAKNGGQRKGSKQIRKRK